VAVAAVREQKRLHSVRCRLAMSGAAFRSGGNPYALLPVSVGFAVRLFSRGEHFGGFFGGKFDIVLARDGQLVSIRRLNFCLVGTVLRVWQRDAPPLRYR